MSPPSLDANDTPFAQPVAAPVILVPVFDGPTATPAVPISPFSPVAIPAVSTVSKIDNNSFETAQTALPTSSPTIKLLATAEQHHFTRTVQAHPLFLRVVGQFDPKEEEEEFFVIVKEGFKPYSRAYISEMLNEYDIAMLFLNDLIQETKEANGTVLTTSWCQVNVTFEVASETESTVNHFTTEKASQLVVKFFMDGHKTRLINGFDQADIAVLDIEALEVLPNDVKAILDAATGSASRSGEPPPLNDEPSGSSKSSIAVLAASGGVMLLALGAIVLTRRNNKRVSDMHGSASLVPGDDIDKYPSKALAFVSGESLNEVKPAALQVRNRRERARQAVMSSNNTVATYFTTETALSNFTKVEKYSAAKGEVQASETRLVDIAAFSALTCLNGKESVGALNKAYPEFEMYQSSASPPPSPVWSIDNYSNASPYSVDDDYVAERRRWHDVANDLDMIALPDTNSEYSSHHSRDSQARKMDEI